MDDATCQFMDALGGTSAVATLIRTPLTTVHSWRKSGIPDPRLDHIKLAADARGKAVELAAALPILEPAPMLPFDAETSAP